MLKPDYFDGKEERLLDLYRKLEDYILRDVSRRMLSAKKLTASADWMIYKLRQMGESRENIEQKLTKITGMSREELKRLLREAVLTSWDDDQSTFSQIGAAVPSPLENSAVIAIMDAEYKKSLGELENLTKTTMDQAQKDLIRLLDEAEIRTASGAQTYSEAVSSILDEYAGKGIMVEYPSGTRRTLEAAVRCCVVTSMNQTSAQVTNQYIKEAKSEYVIVSAHLGARTQQKGQPFVAGHDNWQGKVYKMTGSEPGIPNLLEATGYNIDPVTGVGTVVNPLGLHGYNCRHSHGPWDKDLKNPYTDEDGNLKIDTEENRKTYNTNQKQRAMERAIRKTKRRLIVKQEIINGSSGVEKEIRQREYDSMAYQLTEQNSAYNSFCRANSLVPQYERGKVAGFGTQQQKAANRGYKRYKNWLEDKR